MDDVARIKKDPYMGICDVRAPPSTELPVLLLNQSIKLFGTEIELSVTLANVFCLYFYDFTSCCHMSDDVSMFLGNK